MEQVNSLKYTGYFDASLAPLSKSSMLRNEG